MNRLRPWMAAVAAALALPTAASAASWADLCRAGAAHFEIERVIAGGEDADDAHTLYVPAAVAFDADGNVLVLDYKLCCVKRFTPDGAYLGSFGREGEGPGELRGAGEMTVTANGSIVIYESLNRRFSVFDARGGHLKSVGWFEGMRMCWGLATGSGGRLWALFDESDMESFSGVTANYFVRLDDEFQVAEVIDSLRVRETYSVQSEGTINSYSAPFIEEIAWCVLSGGRIATAHSREYRIQVRSPTGETVATLERDVAGPLVTDEDKAAYFAAFERGGRAGMVDAARRMIEFPKRRPVIDNLLADASGDLIVDVAQPRGKTPVYDIFDPSGAYIGAVSIASFPRHPVFTDDGFVYGAHVSKGDLPKVCRFRVVAGDAGARGE
jgi:hypothetical protein